MYNFITLKCHKCDSVMMNLPERIVAKLHGMDFRCENCGCHNVLLGPEFSKSQHIIPSRGISRQRNAV